LLLHNYLSFNYRQNLLKYMSSKRFLFTGLCVVVITTSFTACKKDTVGNSFQRMVGKWKQVEYATDDNNNGIMDPQEIHNVDKSYDDEIKFNQDSTGVETVIVGGTTTNYPFTWMFTEGQTIQRNGVGHDTVTYSVQSITSESLTLMTQTGYGAAWYIYAKK